MSIESVSAHSPTHFPQNGAPPQTVTAVSHPQDFSSLTSMEESCCLVQLFECIRDFFLSLFYTPGERLYDACDSGDLETARHLLSQLPDREERCALITEKVGAYSPLEIAICCGQLNVVSLLLDQLTEEECCELLTGNSAQTIADSVFQTNLSVPLLDICLNHIPHSKWIAFTMSRALPILSDRSHPLYDGLIDMVVRRLPAHLRSQFLSTGHEGQPLWTGDRASLNAIKAALFELPLDQRMPLLTASDNSLLFYLCRECEADGCLSLLVSLFPNTPLESLFAEITRQLHDTPYYWDILSESLDWLEAEEGPKQRLYIDKLEVPICDLFVDAIQNQMNSEAGTLCSLLTSDEKDEWLKNPGLFLNSLNTPGEMVVAIGHILGILDDSEKMQLLKHPAVNYLKEIPCFHTALLFFRTYLEQHDLLIAFTCYCRFQMSQLQSARQLTMIGLALKHLPDTYHTRFILCSGAFHVWCASNCQDEIAALLKDKSLEQLEHYMGLKYAGGTPLHFAHAEAMELLLSPLPETSIIKLLKEANKKGLTPLYSACLRGDVAAAKKLLNYLSPENRKNYFEAHIRLLEPSFYPSHLQHIAVEMRDYANTLYQNRETT